MAKRVTPRVLFRVAAGPRIGFGHLCRACALGDALGVTPLVSLRGGAGARKTARRLGVRLVAPGPPAAVLSRSRPDLLIIDDREAAATRNWRHAARRARIPIASVHDLGIGTGDCDLLVDGSASAPRSLPEGCRRLLGPSHAILGREVARLVSQPRPVAGRPPKIVVSLGGGPRRRLAVRLAREIARKSAGATVKVAAGFLSAADRGDGLVSPIPPPELAAELASCTIAVVGGGVTLYETCALGVPAVGVAVVASQLPTTRAFARRRAAVDGGLLEATAVALDRRVARVASTCARLLEDAARRRSLSRQGRRLVDGRGASRVAAALGDLMARRKA